MQTNLANGCQLMGFRLPYKYINVTEKRHEVRFHAFYAWGLFSGMRSWTLRTCVEFRVKSLIGYSTILHRPCVTDFLSFEIQFYLPSSGSDYRIWYITIDSTQRPA
jgi:hypothetical protein